MGGGEGGGKVNARWKCCCAGTRDRRTADWCRGSRVGEGGSGGGGGGGVGGGVGGVGGVSMRVPHVLRFLGV